MVGLGRIDDDGCSLWVAEEVFLMGRKGHMSNMSSRGGFVGAVTMVGSWSKVEEQEEKLKGSTKSCHSGSRPSSNCRCLCFDADGRDNCSHCCHSRRKA